MQGEPQTKVGSSCSISRQERSRRVVARALFVIAFPWRIYNPIGNLPVEGVPDAVDVVTCTLVDIGIYGYYLIECGSNAALKGITTAQTDLLFDYGHQSFGRGFLGFGISTARPHILVNRVPQFFIDHELSLYDIYLSVNRQKAAPVNN